MLFILAIFCKHVLNNKYNYQWGRSFKTSSTWFEGAQNSFMYPRFLSTNFEVQYTKILFFLRILDFV